MELQHASLAQVQKGRDGRVCLVEEDVLDVVGQIRALGPLKVLWNEHGEYFTVVEDCGDGRERLVTTSPVLDQRLVDHLRRIGSSSWNAGLEMDKAEDRVKAVEDGRWKEQVGEKAEVLAHAVRKDLQYKGRVYLPKGVHV